MVRTSSDNGAAPSQPRLSRSREINMVRIRWGAEQLLSGETAMGVGGWGNCQDCVSCLWRRCSPYGYPHSPWPGLEWVRGPVIGGRRGRRRTCLWPVHASPLFFCLLPGRGINDTQRLRYCCVWVRGCQIFLQNTENGRLHALHTHYLRMDSTFCRPFVLFLKALNGRRKKARKFEHIFSKETTALSGAKLKPTGRGHQRGGNEI